MRTLRALLFAAAGLVAGGAAAVAVVVTCNLAPPNGPPDWTLVPGIVLLVLGPVAGVVAGIVLAMRTGRP